MSCLHHFESENSGPKSIIPLYGITITDSVYSTSGLNRASGLAEIWTRQLSCERKVTSAASYKYFPQVRNQIEGIPSHLILELTLLRMQRPLGLDVCLDI
jgi:hypothetical protein